MNKKTDKAYNNKDFLNGKAARPVRVLCELIEPEERLEENNIENTIVFFGSARPKEVEMANRELSEFEKKYKSTDHLKSDLQLEHARLRRIQKLSKYYDDAVQLANKVSTWSRSQSSEMRNCFVCSGGGPGIMEAANRGAKEAGSKSIALGISLPFEQGVNEYASPELSFEFHYFFIRKFYFLYHAKAVFAFPGGFGTMDELFETLTLLQTNKLNKKMPIFLYGKEFWEGLINFNKFVEWGVISPQDLELFKIVDSVEEAFASLIDEIGRTE
ncbi:MAG: lysine decarboxylase [Opitutae bacterium]|nr:lysine decarboxylase [Opitutae bacterium]HAD21987.1 lysine decarboxylase [Opitutae bacterium]